MKGAAVLLLAFAGCSAAQRPRSPAPEEELRSLQQRIVSLRESSPLESTSDPDRCRKLRTIAAEICRCAERICVLSEEIADDESRRACTRAHGDCERARSEADVCK